MKYTVFKAAPGAYEIRKLFRLKTTVLEVVRTQKMANTIRDALEDAYETGYLEGQDYSHGAPEVKTVFLRRH